MTVTSPLVLRIHLKSSDRPKGMSVQCGLSTKTTSNASCPSSTTVCNKSYDSRKKPSGTSKETRRERNRITARESRDRKAAYVSQLEEDIKRLNERVSQLESELIHVAPNPFLYTSDTTTLMLSPDQMGFFDCP